MKNSTNQKIRNYGALAGTVLLSVSAKSDIIYSNPNPDIDIINNSFDLDIDSNGTTDFRFTFNYLYSTFTMWSNTYVSMSSSNLIQGINNTQNQLVLNNYGYANQLYYGSYYIGAYSSNYNWGNQGSLQFSGQNHVIGVKFDISGSVHYGWVRLRYEPVPLYGPSARISIMDYAYESCADTRILTMANSSSQSHCIQVSNDTVIACNSVTLDSITYYSSQVVQTYLPGGAQNGGDSLHVLNIQVNNSSFDTLNISACESFAYQGNLFLSDTLFSDSLFAANVNGCDSIVTYDISILPLSYQNININECDSFIQLGIIYKNDTIIHDTIYGVNIYGCDSILTYNVNINNHSHDTIRLNGIESLVYNDSTYSSTTTFNDTMIGANMYGCDSIINTSITITPNAPSGIELVNGPITLHPALVHDVLRIECDEQINKISIINAVGAIEKKISNVGKICTLDLSDLTSGIYFVLVNDNYTKKFIKE